MSVCSTAITCKQSLYSTGWEISPHIKWYDKEKTNKSTAGVDVKP